MAWGGTCESTWRPSTCSSLLPCRDCLASRRTRVVQGGRGRQEPVLSQGPPARHGQPVLCASLSSTTWVATHLGPAKVHAGPLRPRFGPARNVPHLPGFCRCHPPLRDAGVRASVLPASGPWPYLGALVGTADAAAATATCFACARLLLLATLIDYYCRPPAPPYLALPCLHPPPAWLLSLFFNPIAVFSFTNTTTTTTTTTTTRTHTIYSPTHTHTHIYTQTRRPQPVLPATIT